MSNDYALEQAAYNKGFAEGKAFARDTMIKAIAEEWDGEPSGFLALTIGRVNAAYEREADKKSK